MFTALIALIYAPTQKALVIQFLSTSNNDSASQHPSSLGSSQSHILYRQRSRRIQRVYYNMLGE